MLEYLILMLRQIVDSNFQLAIAVMKMQSYEQRIREDEHGSFVPLVLSVTGGMG